MTEKEKTMAQKIAADEGPIVPEQKGPIEPEQKKVEFKTTMSLVDFATELLRLNNAGRDFTLAHQEKWGVSKADAKDNKGGKRYHAPATKMDNTCPDCNKILDIHNAYMTLQAEQLGVTGIEFSSIMSAIKITRATILMMKIGGELE